MLGALIGAGASLLGGILSSNAQEDAVNAQNAYNDPSAVRARFEAAGVNPLIGLQQGGVGLQSSLGGSNYMGSAIADAGLLAADAIDRNGKNAKISALEKQNTALQDALKKQTLRPKVGGLYASSETTPSIRQAVGGNDGRNFQNNRPNTSVIPAGGNVTDAFPPLSASDAVDTRRGVDNKPIGNTAGVMVVENPYVGKVYFPTIDGDEPLDVLDVPSMLVGGPQLAYNVGGYLSSGGTLSASDKKRRAEFAAKGQEYLANKELARSRPRPKSYSKNFYPSGMPHPSVNPKTGKPW